MKRRHFLLGAATLAAAGAGAFVLSKPAYVGRAQAAKGGRSLPIPNLIDAGRGAIGKLEAISGKSRILSGAETRTLGYSQPYLGPTVRVKRGETAPMVVTNRTRAPITAHWHGLHIKGAFDGGPQTAFIPGKSWSPELEIDQPASTLWYHSHVHGETGPQVYSGLAGMMIIEDPDAPPSGLPDTYGVDDLPLIVQDRAFDTSGQLIYIRRGPALMHGFRAGEILVNGAIRPKASVPRGLVRLRVLNASNARIYTFSFSDGRDFYRVASDGGLLSNPVPTKALMLAPAERAEIVVDFSDARSVRLLSLPDFNEPMSGRGMGRGMMRRFMGGDVRPPTEASDDGHFEIMTFEVDAQKQSAVQKLPSTIAGAPVEPDWGPPVRRRQFRLDMGMGRGMMHGNDAGDIMAINGKSMSMSRIDVEARRGETELWQVTSDMMAHPFHVHGTSFKVVTENRNRVPFGSTGLKDVVLIDGSAEILVNFSKPADRAAPFMYHCHILEHEDAGMMGQFTVS